MSKSRSKKRGSKKKPVTKPQNRNQQRPVISGDVNGNKTVAGQVVTSKRSKEEEKDARTEDNLELKALPFRKRMAVKRKRMAEEMQGMTKKEKARYLLYYFKWPAIITVLAILVAIFLGIAIYQGSRPVALSVGVLNKASDKKLDEDAFASYIKARNIPDSYRIEIDDTIHLDAKTYDQDYENNPNDPSFSQFPILCRENYFDFLITNRAGMEFCSATGLLRLPENTLDSGTASNLTKYEVKSEDYAGSLQVYGYDISETEFGKSLDLGMSELYICFPGNSDENRANAEHFIEYIFDIKPDNF